ncbi:MAG: TatD family hydrolase, partial [Verrucomicrobia bacterium]|nr:TatD family hydrolase [Verrucomicrobiota bacterium]
QNQADVMIELGDDIRNQIIKDMSPEQLAKVTAKLDVDDSADFVQSLPDELNSHPLSDPATVKAINHPANLRAVYECAAKLRGEPLEELASCVAENFLRLFGAR